MRSHRKVLRWLIRQPPYCGLRVRALAAAAGAGVRVLASAPAGARRLWLRGAPATRAVVVVVGLLPQVVLVVLVVVVRIWSVACFRRVLRIGSSRKKFLLWSGSPCYNGCSLFLPRGGRCPPHPIRTFLIFFIPRAARGFLRFSKRGFRTADTRGSRRAAAYGGGGLAAAGGVGGVGGGGGGGRTRFARSFMCGGSLRSPPQTTGNAARCARRLPFS